MECKDARLLLEFRRPGSDELPTEDAALLEQHLAGCPLCRILAEQREYFDAAVGRAMTAVEVPDGLRTRLMARLDAARDAWYRKLLIRCVAAAAAVVLAVWLGWSWRANWLPGVDLAQVKEEVSDQIGPSLSQVETWLQSVGGAHLSAPPQLRYSLVVRYGMDTLQGRRVPGLMLVHNDPTGQRSIAHVYVFSDANFHLPSIEANVKAIQEEDAKNVGLSGRVKVDLLPSTNPRVRYVIIYTGNLNVFLGQDRGGAIF